MSAMKRAMIWHRARSRVVKPPQPHWFFSSKGIFAIGAIAVELGERQNLLLKACDKHAVFVGFLRPARS